MQSHALFPLVRRFTNADKNDPSRTSKGRPGTDANVAAIMSIDATTLDRLRVALTILHNLGILRRARNLGEHGIVWDADEHKLDAELALFLEQRGLTRETTIDAFILVAVVGLRSGDPMWEGAGKLAELVDDQHVASLFD